MTEIEAELVESLARSRARLKASTEELTGRFSERLDPFGPVRRSPIGSLLTVAAVGALVGAFGSTLLSSRHRHSEGGGPSGGMSPIGMLFSTVVPTIVPLIAEVLRERAEASQPSPGNGFPDAPPS